MSGERVLGRSHYLRADSQNLVCAAKYERGPARFDLG
jgi:hypothetical protein